MGKKNAFGIDDETAAVVKAAFDDGVVEGRREMKVEVLTYLEKKYVKGTFSRSSHEAKAILQVVRDISSELNR